mgnify:CR=1 FL=1
MAYQSIGLGTTEGDGTGDTLRIGGDKVNDNFVEIYTLLGTGSALTSGISATSSVVTLAGPTITGVASFADGSVSAPSITNTGDTNTGIFFSAADKVNVTTAGTERLEIDSSGLGVTGAVTTSGRVIVDDTTAATSTTDGSLQTDGGLSVALDAVVGDDLLLLSDAAVIHFGANSEITATHVHDVGLTLTHTATGDNAPMVLQLKSEEDAIIADEVIASLEFAAGDSDGTDGATVAAGIHAIAEGTFAADANATKLVFTTGVSETAAASATAKMTLSSAGLLTIADDLVIGDGKTIGSASDADAMTIASNGVVTFSQIPVLPADSIDSNDLKTLSTLLIKNSGGSTLATFHCAGA